MLSLLPEWLRVSEETKGPSFGLQPREHRVGPLKGPQSLTSTVGTQSKGGERVSFQGPLRRWCWSTGLPTCLSASHCRLCPLALAS